MHHSRAPQVRPQRLFIRAWRLQGIAGPAYFDLQRSWTACSGYNEGVVRAAERATASDKPQVEFGQLHPSEQRLLVKVAFETVTREWAGRFTLKQGYDHFAAVLGDSCFWPRASLGPGARGLDVASTSTADAANAEAQALLSARNVNAALQQEWLSATGVSISDVYSKFARYLSPKANMAVTFGSTMITDGSLSVGMCHVTMTKYYHSITKQCQSTWLRSVN
jgi:hypothetical protein